MQKTLQCKFRTNKRVGFTPAEPVFRQLCKHNVMDCSSENLSVSPASFLSESCLLKTVKSRLQTNRLIYDLYSCSARMQTSYGPVKGVVCLSRDEGWTLKPLHVGADLSPRSSPLADPVNTWHVKGWSDYVTKLNSSCEQRCMFLCLIMFQGLFCSHCCFISVRSVIYSVHLTFRRKKKCFFLWKHTGGPFF